MRSEFRELKFYRLNFISLYYISKTIFAKSQVQKYIKIEFRNLQTNKAK